MASLWETPGAVSEANSPPLDRGLVFLYERDALISNSRWNLVFSLNIHQYQKLSEEISVNIKNLIRDSSYPELELNQIKQATDSVSARVDSFLHLLANRRPTRGLIDGLGYAMRYLFGTAMNEQVVQVSRTVEDLQKEDKEVVHNINEQVTFSKNLNLKVNDNLESIKAITSTLEMMYSNAKNERAELNSTVETFIRNYTMFADHTRVLRELENLVGQLKDDIQDIQLGLSTISHGKLAPALVSPEVLEKAMSEISTKLPAGTFLLIEPSYENMLMVYDSLSARAYATRDDIRIVVAVPIGQPDQIMNIYRAYPLPVFQPALNRHLQIEGGPEYIGVSVSREKYVLMSEQSLMKCHESGLTVCQGSMPVYPIKIHSCLGALFFNQQEVADQHCKKVILPVDFAPVWLWHEKGQRWIYSVPKPQKVTTKCSITGAPARPQFTVKDIGTLDMTQGCQIYTDGATLLPFTQFETDIRLSSAAYQVPEMPRVLSMAQEKVLNASRDQIQEALHKLSLKEAGTGQSQQYDQVDLHYLISHLQSNPTWTLPHPGCSILTLSLLTLGALFICCHPCTRKVYRRWKLKSESKPKVEGNSIHVHCGEEPARKREVEIIQMPVMTPGIISASAPTLGMAHQYLYQTPTPALVGSPA